MKVCWFRGKNADSELEPDVSDAGKGLYIYIFEQVTCRIDNSTISWLIELYK